MFQYVIICPLLFLAGFIDAIAGGGGLISLPAYMITGIPVHECIATNKMSSSMGTSIATARYAFDGFIPWKTAVFCIPCAFAGSTLGANIALQISDGPFRILMLVIIPLTAVYVLTRRKIEPEGEPFSVRTTTCISMGIAFVIGIYDGFYGPGTGTFLILLLTGVARMRLNQANGLTKAINFSTNVSALTVYLINGQVLFPLGIIAGFFNIAGNFLGARNFENGGGEIVKPAILTVLAIFFVRVLGELVF